jgi:ribosome biogenesis GTPase
MRCIVLTKTDLIENVGEWIATAGASAPGVDVIALSALTGAGVDALDTHLIRRQYDRAARVHRASEVDAAQSPRRTSLMRTGDVRDDGRGRHTTTASGARYVCPAELLVIDTPGMRELQLWSAESGLAQTFDDIAALSESCRFADCAHASEPGCAVAMAIESGALDAERLASWRKLSREAARAELQRDALAAAAQRNKVKSIPFVSRSVHHKREVRRVRRRNAIPSVAPGDTRCRGASRASRSGCP